MPTVPARSQWGAADGGASASAAWSDGQAPVPYGFSFSKLLV
ncbi:hypothetical protein OG897_29110 [Streptomyces sp. NBC_00237]|nr:hypothetical protein [Streptomyces sp. NBC_00237]MCX5205506.1 hypothetical protein [Streptomyces sp. NBC_00237]